MITDEQRQHNTTRNGVPTLHQPLPKYIYQTRYFNRKSRGLPVAPINSEHVRNHINHLLQYGMTDSMIAAAAGCANTTITEIRNNQYDRTKRHIANRILTTTHHPHPRQKLCLAIGATRRIHALQALGWPLATLAQHLNTNTPNLQRIPRKTRIQYQHWNNIHNLYNQLSATPGPSPHARRVAQRHNYAPPLAWYDIDIDHPHSKPATAKAKR